MAPIYIVLMGVQGAGKGTQATVLKKELNLPHVSTGDLMRAMKTQNTPLARQVQEIMRDGKLVPDDITIQLLKDRLDQPDAANGAILDGFPRTRAQAKALEVLLKERGSKVAVVPYFHLDRDVAINRIVNRRVSSTHPGEMYN